MKPKITYQQLLTRLKAEIQSARIKASLTANVQMLVLYWKLGKTIANQEGAEGWGAKVVDQLAKDLRHEFPNMKGISPRNLRYMREFAKAYPQFLQQPAATLPEGEVVQAAFAKKGKKQILQQPAAKLDDRQIVQVPPAQLSEAESVAQLVAQLPWFHICTLLDKVKDPDERLFYMRETAAHGWSRAVLVHQIESGLYKRKVTAVTNFEATLPKPQSDLAKELLKDPYKFDFLSLGEEYKERDLENALVEHITKFLLELGTGFSYVGRQYPLPITDSKDRRIDLLFYHLKLRCFVVIDLKAKPFEPEAAGKMNFYLNMVDDKLRHPADEPSIGIIICKERNKVVAEYALRGLAKPIGVTEYELTEAIPDSLKGSLPTIEQIEEELNDK